jgi:hypothetical protein
MPTVTNQKLTSIIIPILFIVCIALFVSAITVKHTVGKDEISDTLKMSLVTINALIVLGISVSNFDVLSKKRGLMISLLIVGACFVGCFAVNVFLLNQQFKELESETDFWVLAMTLLTDMTFLSIYSFFKSTRAVWLTLFMIATELVIFGVAFTMKDDHLIDISNVGFALITAILSLVLWSGRLTAVDGEARFYDYYEMRNYPAAISAVVSDGSAVAASSFKNAEIKV